MKLVKLSEYFEIHNGVAKNNVIVKNVKEGNDFIPYIRPAQSYESSLDGYIDKNSVPQNKIFPQYTIYISTDGEGSHSYAYVSSFEFAPNSNVIALVEKIPLTITEKLFYAKCITSNRHKFSYARKPKQNRITNLLIPAKESIPAFVYKQKIRTVSNKPLNEGKIELDVRGWKIFSYEEIFEIYGGYYNKKPEEVTNGNIPFIGATEKNNGVTSLHSIDIIERSSKDGSENNHDISKKILKGGEYITISNNGSVGCAFYQPLDFTCSHDINPIKIKNGKVNQYVAMFLCTLIELEKYKWAFGRKWRPIRMPKSIIKLPATPQGEPDWEFMENYIKSLPFSSSL